MRTYLHEIIAYTKTWDYFHGVVAGLTVLAIEVLLLSITVPIAIHLFNRIRTKRLRVTVDFYVFKVFHKITRMLLAMASVEDTLPILRAEQVKNPEFSIESHPVYGNLENILFVLNKTFEDGDRFGNSLKNKTLTEMRGYLGTCDRCMDEIDRLVAMLSNLPRLQQEIFETRVLAYLLRDQVQNVADDLCTLEENRGKFSLSDHLGDLQECARMTTKAIDEIFQKRRKLTDSTLKRRHMWSVLRLVCSTPYIAVRRWILIPWCRLWKKRYLDWPYPSYAPVMLTEWREKYGFSLAEAATILEMSEGGYRDLEYGYREPSFEQWEPVRKHLRGEVDYSKPRKAPRVAHR